MQNVLVDDRRIWVDFSQSVAKTNQLWSNDIKRGPGLGSRSRGSGFGGREDLVQTRKYRDEDGGSGGGYGMVFDIPRNGRDRDRGSRKRSRSGDQGGRERKRSASPRRDDRYRDDRQERDYDRRRDDDRRRR